MRTVETFYEKGEIFLKARTEINQWLYSGAVVSQEDILNQSEALTFVRNEIRHLKAILELLEGHDVL